MLKHLLEQSSKSPMHFYNEFVMDDQKIMERKAQKTALSNEDIEHYRKNEIRNFFNQPKLTELSHILQNIISDSVFNMVQCSKVSDYDLSNLEEQIEKNLYTCRAKMCNCKNHPWNKTIKIPKCKTSIFFGLKISQTVHTYYNNKFQFGQTKASSVTIKIALKVKVQSVK